MKRWLVVMVVLAVLAFSSNVLAANVDSDLNVDSKRVSSVFGDKAGGGPVYATSSDGGAIWPKGIWGL